MTAEIITFTVAKRSAGEALPVISETLRKSLHKAMHWKEMGLGLEDIPADTNPHIRRIIEIMLDPASLRDPDGDTPA